MMFFIYVSPICSDKTVLKYALFYCQLNENDNDNAVCYENEVIEKLSYVEFLGFTHVLLVESVLLYCPLNSKFFAKKKLHHLLA